MIDDMTYPPFTIMYDIQDMYNIQQIWHRLSDDAKLDMYIHAYHVLAEQIKNGQKSVDSFGKPLW